MSNKRMTATEIEPEERSLAEGQPQKLGYTVLILLALLLVLGAAMAVAIRLHERRALARETEALALPNVTVIQPSLEPSKQELVLPSTLQSYTESPIYARTNGYLKRWYKDIGSHVKKGELLADIETP
ncbi:MAG: efflux transporter periplasmic adaptor subunit, partial [Acidobacteria bacterium]|nr:efflux transporter periplasmic adaptor subunit [Acidobacteriota bacterium]